MSLYHQLALTQVPGIGAVTAKALLAHFGAAEAVFKAPQREILQVGGIGPKLAHQIKAYHDFDRIVVELEFIQKNHIRALFIEDEAYPKRLAQCYDAPLLLFYAGNADLNQQKIISVVGTRSATDYGYELCREMIQSLKNHEPLIVSGLAYGIDACAHKACLKEKLPTLGVLGHGLDRIYPAEHRKLAEQMMSCGGLLTEFISKTNPDRENFPKRNRIIAGMADVTIVVEANLKGGALITAELANNYNRDVFAFPGRVHDEQSSGCNYLIKTNRANLITNVADIEYLLGWSRHENPKKQQISMPLNLSLEEERLFKLLVQQQLTIDELMLATSMPQSKLAVLLLEMELKGFIRALPGKAYKLT